jgi:ZIP family zinc transporter
MSAVLVRSTIATLIAFGGGAFGVGLARLASRHLNVLVYAASGALLAVTVWDILPDAGRALSPPALLLAAASGYGLLWLIGRHVSPVCPACAISALDLSTARGLRRAVVLLMVAIGIHSTMDGVAVAVGDQIVGRANLGVLFAVSLHKLPEGMALALLLVGAGYAGRTALGWTIGIEATTEVGALVGVLALRNAPLPVLGLLFAHIGGGFLYIVASASGAFTVHRERRSVRRMLSVGSLAFLLTSSLLRTADMLAR